LEDEAEVVLEEGVEAEAAAEEEEGVDFEVLIPPSLMERSSIRGATALSTLRTFR
jgi:hypothetical protein